MNSKQPPRSPRTARAIYTGTMLIGRVPSRIPVKVVHEYGNTPGLRDHVLVVSLTKGDVYDGFHAAYHRDSITAD